MFRILSGVQRCLVPSNKLVFIELMRQIVPFLYVGQRGSREHVDVSAASSLTAISKVPPKTMSTADDDTEANASLDKT